MHLRTHIMTLKSTLYIFLSTVRINKIMSALNIFCTNTLRINISKSKEPSLCLEKTMLYLLFLLLKLQSLLQLTVSVSTSSSSHSPLRAWANAKPGCQDQCGNITIPYPFGITANCYYNSSYEISCNTSFHPPKPFLQQFNLEVLDINWNGRFPIGDPRNYDSKYSYQVVTVVIKKKVFQNTCRTDFSKTNAISSTDLRGSPYSFSTQFNVLLVEGCGADVVVKSESRGIVTGCASICTNVTMKGKECGLGIGCCQAALSASDNVYGGLDFYEIYLRHSTLSSSLGCNVTAGIMDQTAVTNISGEISSLKTFSTVLEWRFVDDKHAHSDNSICYSPGLNCQCNDFDGYEGNPYLPNGCQLVEECQKCKHGCEYNGTSSDGRSTYACNKRHLLSLASVLGFSISTGLVALLLAGYWFYRLVMKIKEVKQKANHFKRNGGLLLKEQISSKGGVVEKTLIFRLNELEKATNNFSEDRILGQGGQGTVYKGMLEDGRIVAIKKSKKIDKSQLTQFINEMVVLSSINHRSVVKLQGCCLETEVPLLVYEFIQNGTLYQHIQDPSEDFRVTWKMRLQIASESASALAYLHSSSSSPIYHRDIKSSNILLDEKYRAKVSDFGMSRAITIEQTHVTTCVQGTFGYLDPEYFRSNQFTEKSDVYSFGVVLVELITSKKPILPNGSGEWVSLASEFLFHMEKSKMFDMVDTSILEEAKEEELISVANLAKQCLNMKGKERPTMKQVSMVLDGIRSGTLYNTKELDCLESNEFVVMEHNYPVSTSSSILDNTPSSSFFMEALPLMANNN